MATVPIHTAPGEIEVVEKFQRFSCPICKQIGVEDYPDASDWSDERGNKLRDARMTPSNDWVCSQPCLSQLMFEQASPREQDALRRYELALRELRESSDDTEDLLKLWECHVDIKPYGLELARYALGAMNRRSPKNNAAWVENNESPEDRMRDAIGEVLHLLDWKVTERLAFIVRYLKIAAARGAFTVVAGPVGEETGRALGTLYTVISKLKAAVAGEVAR